MSKTAVVMACVVAFAGSIAAQEIFSDGFETGHMGAWSAVVGGCGDGTCDVNAGETQSTCTADCSVPGGWTCNSAWYAANDFCDCECGAWDPDCAVAGLDIINCSGAEQCVPPGVCYIEDFPVAWCNVQFPTSLTLEEGLVRTVYGLVSIPGLTDLTTGPDPHSSVVAEVGVGPDGVDPGASPTQFGWGAASVNPHYSSGTNDEYMADMVVPPAQGGATSYDYAYRFSGNEGTTWSYCDIFDDVYDIGDAGDLTSTPTTVVAAPSFVGDLIITEIMQNPAAVPDSEGEYFEVYNPTGSDFNLQGCFVGDFGLDSHTISSAVVVPAGGYAVLARSENAGFMANYVYSGVVLSNGADELVIECGATLIDSVAWDGGPSFPHPNGASMNLDRLSYDVILNDSGSNWCESTTRYSENHLGTPRQANEICP